MCDFVSIWCQSVKLELNAIKSIFMVFSSLRNAPTVALEISNTVIPRSKSCLYLSITIDDKLSWDIHLSNKCIAVKRLLFLIYKCCCLTWGLSRSAISLLYKITVISTILYNCVVWASDIRKKKVVAALCSAQLPFALTISRLFKSRQERHYLLLRKIWLEMKIRRFHQQLREVLLSKRKEPNHHVLAEMCFRYQPTRIKIHWVHTKKSLLLPRYIGLNFPLLVKPPLTFVKFCLHLLLHRHRGL